MEKHHGVSLEHVFIVSILFATYEATSVSDLEVKALKDTALAAVMDGVRPITQPVLRYYEGRHDDDTLARLVDRFLRRAHERDPMRRRACSLIASSVSVRGPVYPT